MSGWPTQVKIPSVADKNKIAWGWICPECVASGGASLVGRSVKVWWADDEALYGGKLDAYDAASGKHRVFYEDEEWEFISLASEPVVVAFNTMLNHFVELHRNVFLPLNADIFPVWQPL